MLSAALQGRSRTYVWMMSAGVNAAGASVQPGRNVPTPSGGTKVYRDEAVPQQWR